MKSFTKYVVATAAGTLLTAGAHAFDVTATVSNTITLTETTAMTLGSIFARVGVDADATTNSTPAFITITAATGGIADTAATADGDAGDSISKLISLGGGTAGTLSVSGAQAFGTVTITHGSLTNLVHSSANPSLPVITFTSLDSLPANAGTLTLDATGAGDIIVGGVFTAAESGTASPTQYQDGVYTGTYALTVSY